jgi:hypothetical protein
MQADVLRALTHAAFAKRSCENDAFETTSTPTSAKTATTAPGRIAARMDVSRIVAGRALM